MTVAAVNPRIKSVRTPASSTPDRSVRTILMSTDAVGGVWRYSVDLGRALGQRGVRTILAAMGPAPDPMKRREAVDAGLHLVHRAYRLEWMDDPWADVGRAGQWLLALAKTLAVDIVHLNGYAHAKLPWPAPVVVVAHSCVRTWWRGVTGDRAPARLARYTQEVGGGLAAASVVVAPTAAMLAALRREYAVAGPSCVIPNGCAPGNFGAALPQPEKDPIILTAGRVWDDAKNIRALAEVAGDLSWPVFVAGDCRGPTLSDRRFPSIQLLGSLSRAELDGWLRRAAVYALPACYEPFGLSVLEAAQAGCALVLGDIASLRENWDGAALFVPPHDRAALHAALARVIADPLMRVDLGRRARDRALAFSLDRTAEQYLRLYEGLVQ
jgi:glycosyltransferase involved in cell wall biosynthesis